MLQELQRSLEVKIAYVERFVFLLIPIVLERMICNIVSAILPFDDLTDNTNIIMKKAFKVLDRLYRPNHNYKKIGVILLDLKQRKKDFRNNNYVIQDNLFTYDKNYKNIVDLSDIHMKILDNINAKMGKMTIFYGSQGMVKYSGRKKIEKDKWRMRSFYRSPFYTQIGLTY